MINKKLKSGLVRHNFFNQPQVFKKIGRAGKKLGGFSILETLIAMMVLSLVLLGSFSLVSFSLKSASISKNRITAFFLAVEPIEYIRNWRDNNFINNPGSWLNGIPISCFTNSTPVCTVDVTIEYNDNDAFVSCVLGVNCPPVKYDPSDGYNHNSGDDTIFTRTVRLTKFDIMDGELDELLIEVDVEWNEKFGQTKTVTLENRIYNWR